MKSGYRLLAASLVISAIFPCAVDTSPEFIPQHVPEKPDTAFLRGALGIIPATLSDQYKLIAWRYLAGLPLTPGEQQAFPPNRVNIGSSDDAFDSARKWQQARNGGAGISFLNTDKASRIDKGGFYTNCMPDAFATAVKTLNDRRQQYPNAALLEAWETAQDRVFENCSGENPVYPSDPDPAMTPLARADRMYQIAAAHFYAEDLDGAGQRFHAIEADSNSPWHDTAAYMVARTLIREGSLLHNQSALEQAKAQLQKLGATGLVGYVDSLLDPLSTLKSVADKLTVPHPGADIAGTIDLGTYVLTADRFDKVLAQPGIPEPFAWIHSLEANRPDYALQRWQESRSTLWLTAALILATKGNADLIDAGLKVLEDSPAFDTVTFHSIRLMIANGQRDEARRRLDALLAGKRRNLDSVDNAFRGERMSLATSYDDFLRWAPRRPIGIAEDTYPPDHVNDSPILDTDSIDVFNSFVPLAKLVEAAESHRLPDSQRTQLAMMAWTQAYLLKDDAIANSASLLLVKARPAWSSDLDSFRSANGEEKRFAGALAIERHPVLDPRLSFFESEWWCEVQLPEKPSAGPSDAVLSASDKSEAAHEVGELHDTGTTQTFLAPIVMGWAKAHPDDPRVPEALHRLVRITRYGCRDGSDNGRISKAAFDMLHKRYPENNWTRQTPYWFDK